MVLHVNQEPVSVSYVCCDCKEEITETFDDFCALHGDNPYDDWDGASLTCPRCNAVDTVEDFNYE